MGAWREAFCETSLTGAAAFPPVVPSFVTKTEWDKDENYFTQLGELEVLVAALLSKVQDTRSVVGAERYRQSRKFYEAVKSAKEDVPGLQALYETLSEQFEGQGPGGDEPPAPPGGGGGGGGGGAPGGGGQGAVKNRHFTQMPALMVLNSGAEVNELTGEVNELRSEVN